MTDQLYRNVALAHTVQLPVLGVTTSFASNSRDALDAVLESYGTWRSIADRSDVVSPSKAQVKIIVHDGGDRAAAPPAFTYRVPDHTRMLVMAPGTFGIADTVRLESVGYTTASLVSRRAEFAEGLLDPLTFFLLGALDRQPLHATAVMQRSFAILLAGPSGAGKSTLTYAAHRRGYELLGDEPLCVQLWPHLRVWSRRCRLHVPIEARVHFPELRQMPVTRFLSGKTKIVVEPRDPSPARYADRVGVCLLARGSGLRPTLERLSAEAVVSELAARVEPGFDLYADTMPERAAGIAGRGGWRLNVAGSPDDAVPLLDEMVAQLEREG